MSTPFPSPTGPERHAATDPHRTAPVDDPAPGRTWLLPAAIALIAAGAVLVWIVSGSVAGLGTDAIGVVAIALGVIALLTRIAATRRSHGRHGPTVG